MRNIKKNFWKPVAVGWLVAAVGMALGDLIAGGLYVFYQVFVARIPGIAFSAGQVAECLNNSNGVLAGGLVVEGFLTTLGGFTMTRLAGEEAARDGIKLLAVVCELTAVALAYASAASAPAWYYAVSFLFPLPLALLGYGLAYSVGDGVGYAYAPTIPPRPGPRRADEGHSSS